MKKVALFIAFIGLSALSFGQTAEEIINKYFETLGGKEKMNAIQTMEMKAKVDFGGMSIPLQIVSMRDGRQFTKGEGGCRNDREYQAFSRRFCFTVHQL